MEIFYTHKAAKQLEDLPRNVQKRIAQRMRFFAAQKNPLRFAERLMNHREGDFRFRVGDFRIIFDANNGMISVLKIGRRDSIYS